MRFNTDRGFFWDYADRDMRFAVARDFHTGTALGAALADAYIRLRAAGKPNADLFRPARAGQFVQMALGQMGDDYLFSLLNAESRIVSGATDASGDCGGSCCRGDGTGHGREDFVRVRGDSRGHVQRPAAVPVHTRGRPNPGATILAEASAAIHPSSAFRPGAMLKVYVLGPDHAFALNDFLRARCPRPKKWRRRRPS